MTSTIEPAELPGDLDAIAEIARLSFSNPWSREMFARELALQPLSRSYVARTETHDVAAFCTCWVVLDELHVNTVAVRPELRRQGLARRLMEYVLDEAARHGVNRALLEVRRSNVAAVTLYEGLGFLTEAVRKGYYTNPTEDALVLGRRL